MAKRSLLPLSCSRFSIYIPLVVVLLGSLIAGSCARYSNDANVPPGSIQSASPSDSSFETVADDTLLSRANQTSRLNATEEDLQNALRDYNELAQRIRNGKSSISIFDIHWRRARVYFLLSELTQAQDPKMTWITAGEHAANAAIADCGTCVEGYYFSAVLKGRRAEHGGNGFKALRLVKDVLALGKKAAEIDASFDNAAPLRLLAMLYARAPSWPTSVGDMDLALETAARAIEISDYPMNHLIMAEVFIEDGAIEEARRELNIVITSPIEGRWAEESAFWRPYAKKILAKLTD